MLKYCCLRSLFTVLPQGFVYSYDLRTLFTVLTSGLCLQFLPQGFVYSSHLRALFTVMRITLFLFPAVGEQEDHKPGFASQRGVQEDLAARTWRG